MLKEANAIEEADAAAVAAGQDHSYLHRGSSSSSSGSSSSAAPKVPHCVDAYSGPIPKCYECGPKFFFVPPEPGQPKLLIGRLDAVEGKYLKATCLFHHGAVTEKGKGCNAWFRCDMGIEGFHSAKHAARLWCIRGHALNMARDAHYEEGVLVRPVLEEQWRLAKASLPKQ